MEINLKNYKNDKEDTIRINEALKEINEYNGGTLYFEENKEYNISTIRIYSNTTLYIPKTTTIKLVGDLTKFDNKNLKRSNENLDVPSWDDCEYNGMPSMFFIYAKDAHNIKFDGEGNIDGNESIFYGKVTKYHIEGSFYPRIPLLYFENVKDLEIKNITLKNSAFWTVHLVGSENIFIDNLKIKNNTIMTNSDGIDPDHSKNIIIQNSYIEAADDCIVLKTTDAFKKYGLCENIKVKNCTLISTSAAIKIGTESVSDFKNISFKDIYIKNSNRGISFQLRDEGNISDVSFENINIETHRFSPLEWWGKGEAINISAVKRFENTNLGSIKNITFKNIITNGENGVFIFGEDNISNLSFENLEVNLKKLTKWDKNGHDLRPDYKYQMFDGKLTPLFIHGAKNIKFINYKFTNHDKLDIIESVKENITNITFK